MAKYINPFTDVGFKIIFGQEAHPDLLIDFLNCLFQGRRVIADLQFSDKEHPAPEVGQRGVIYDLFCTTDNGEHIIVEMQNVKQANLLCAAVSSTCRVPSPRKVCPDWSGIR